MDTKDLKYEKIVGSTHRIKQRTYQKSRRVRIKNQINVRCLLHNWWWSLGQRLTDLWVNDFLENVVPHLKVRPVLLIHRTKPKGFEDFEFPIETHWQGDNVGEFEKICNEPRRINILHGHYTPMKAYSK